MSRSRRKRAMMILMPDGHVVANFLCVLCCVVLCCVVLCCVVLCGVVLCCVVLCCVVLCCVVGWWLVAGGRSILLL